MLSQTFSVMLYSSRSIIVFHVRVRSLKQQSLTKRNILITSHVLLLSLVKAYVSGLMWRCWNLAASKSFICNDYSWALPEGRNMLSGLTWVFKLWKLSVSSRNVPCDLKDCSLHTAHLGCFAVFAISWPVCSACLILVNRVICIG